MGAVTILLTELASTGIRLLRDGDALRVEVPAGVRLDTYRERIRQHKPSLLARLIQADIIAAVDVEPADFNRRRYDDLWARWYALHATEEITL